MGTIEYDCSHGAMPVLMIIELYAMVHKNKTLEHGIPLFLVDHQPFFFSSPADRRPQTSVGAVQLGERGVLPPDSLGLESTPTSFHM